MFVFLPIFLIMMAMAAVMAVAVLLFAFLVLMTCGAASLLTGAMLVRTGWCLRRGSRSHGLILAFTGMSATALIMVTGYVIAGISGHFSHGLHLLWLPALLCVYGLSTAPIDLVWSLTALLLKLFRGVNASPSRPVHPMAVLKPGAAIVG